MSRRFFSFYQYLAPLVALPLAYWLWLGSAAGDHRVAFWMVAVPVLFAYIAWSYCRFGESGLRTCQYEQIS